MNQPNSSAPRVAVIGGGLGSCRQVPGFRIDVVEPDQTLFNSSSFDLLHVACSEPAGTVALQRNGGLTFLSPGAAGDLRLTAQGVAPHQIHRWRPGVDRERFTPAAYQPDALPLYDATAGERINLLHVGSLDDDPGLDLLIEAFGLANQRDTRLHLLLVGEGTGEVGLRLAASGSGTFLGALEPEALARVYASADLLVFPSVGDLLAQPVLEAQASGLPVLAVDGGGATDLIEDGRSGCLVEASSRTLAEAIYGLGRRGTLRERLVTGALMSVRQHTWERSLDRLAEVWSDALDRPGRRLPGPTVARAA